jgi:DNA polymerase III delta prime subunit
MKGLLKRVARSEGDSLEPEVLDQIVQDSNGHPRNALQILEKVLATDGDKRLEAAQQTAAETNQSIELCRALLNNSNWKQVAAILTGLQGQDTESIRRHVLRYTQTVLLKSDNDKCGLILEEFIEPFYHTGFPQLVYACYAVVKNS